MLHRSPPRPPCPTRLANLLPPTRFSFGGETPYRNSLRQSHLCRLCTSHRHFARYHRLIFSAVQAPSRDPSCSSADEHDLLAATCVCHGACAASLVLMSSHVLHPHTRILPDSSRD